jgi:tetratricopeptide (TPR) repeat protein
VALRITLGLLAVCLYSSILMGCGRQAPDSAPSVRSKTDVPKPGAALLPGLGTLHFPIATKNQEAQRYFDHGLLQFYGFDFEGAKQSFEKASEIDPRAPMPYWGIALTLGPNYNYPIPDSDRERRANDAIQTAWTLESNASDKERAYIDALLHRFSGDQNPDFAKLASDYSTAMCQVSHRYGDDPDAATLCAEGLMDLHAWHLWTPNGAPAEGTERIVSVLEGVLKRWPDHIGANHFYIHAMEASSHPERALTSARFLETAAPMAGHLVHMPGHIYMRVGDYSAAVKSDLAAQKADQPYLEHISRSSVAYTVGYAQHNLLFLTAAADMEGEFGIAFKAASDLESEAKQYVKEFADEEPYLVPKMFVLSRFGRWEEILKLEPPRPELRGLTYFWHYARGCAFAAKGNVPDAESERAAMSATYKSIDAPRGFGMLFRNWSVASDLATQVLDARILTAKGDARGAIQKWTAAVAEQDNMGYHEPPAWYYPIRESLGAARLKAGDPVGAELEFRRNLTLNPHNPRSLFGLAQALTAQHKTAESDQVHAEFESLWKGAVSDLRIDYF